MKKCASDLTLIIGIILAHLLLFFTFKDKSVFWYMLTASMLLLISYSIVKENFDDHASFINFLSYGIGSGLVLFGVFLAGNGLIDGLHLPFKNDVNKLYNRFSPTEIWHYIVLILVIIPGEEIFWRGFVQKRISRHLNRTLSIAIAALLYASVNIYSEFMILPFAAFISGIYWGFLYAWKKSISLVIVSHLVFNLFLLVFMPLK
ncbi:CAAX amino terminal protease family protein [Bacillus methanolicus PB1]|uniref:CAAX amino terminal protease family protein n=1 Tax=Bacillus methanolicus PB1 TaxID=997296 RepID=I3E5D0_BACMT|nr:type II CAAX endopeptidase family protein [Bacillus methanolicus]EIJ81701.1 CAAX amino terminal protease family protein [Bacillus methanolicus PB1]